MKKVIDVRKLISKILGFVLAAILLLAVGWQIGYYRGMVDGKTSVYNARYREQKAIVHEITKDDPILSQLRIDRHGDGNVVLKGRLDRQAIVRLEAELSKRIGASRAKLAVSRVDDVQID